METKSLSRVISDEAHARIHLPIRLERPTARNTVEMLTKVGGFHVKVCCCRLGSDMAATMLVPSTQGGNRGKTITGVGRIALRAAWCWAHMLTTTRRVSIRYIL